METVTKSVAFSANTDRSREASSAFCVDSRASQIGMVLLFCRFIEEGEGEDKGGEKEGEKEERGREGKGDGGVCDSYRS